MDPTPDPIVRRDFPRAPDGYDPAAVDAHLEAVAARVGVVAARVGGAPTGPGASAADRDLLAAGRLLLGQITGLRVELRNASASLRDQSLAIGETLDRLLELDDSPGSASAEQGETPRAALDPAGPQPPPPAADPGPPLEPEETGAPSPPPSPPAAPAATEAVDVSTLADARLVALDMALSGSDREEIGGELARRFGLPAPFALADEILAALG